MNTPERDAAIAQRAKTYHRVGVDALARDQPEDAVRALRMSVKLDPNFDAAWNDLGVVMEALGNPQVAIRCYLRALELRAGFAKARTNLRLLMLEMESEQGLRRQMHESRAAQSVADDRTWAC